MIYEVLVTAQDGAQQTFKVESSGGTWRIDGEGVSVNSENALRDALSLLIGEKSYDVRRTVVGGETVIDIEGARFTVEVRDPRSLRGRRGSGAGTEGPKKITAPMPGKVVRIVALAGTDVESGEGVLVIEAMKMQNELKSPKAGKVAKITVKEGDTVNPGDTLAVVE
jgi:biotin carboxyl carrier protein